MTFLLLLGIICGNGVEERSIHAHLRFLADDLLEGRETTYRGQRLAAKYIESNFSRNGLESLLDSADEPYFQHFSLYSGRVHPTESYVRVGDRQLMLQEDYQFMGANPLDGEITGEVLFIGYPFRSSKEGYNSIDESAMEGKIIVAIDGYPPHLAEKYSDSQRRREHLRDQQFKWITKTKAKALVYLYGPDFNLPDMRPEPISQDLRLAGRLSTTPVKMGGTDFPVIELAPGAAQRVFGEKFEVIKAAFEAVATNQAPANQSLGLEMKIKTVLESQALVTENVVGVVRGTDPELRNEYVVLSAHYDHLGVHGGRVYNGADDNASGTSLLLDLARRFAAKPARRSLIFLCLSGEEKGLLGSAFFVANSPVPLEQIVADINIDMVGRNDIATLGLIPAANEDVTTLNDLAKQLNQKLASPFRFLEDLDGYHRRSDHYNFCRRNIPALFFYSGDHEDYHQPSDTWDKVNYAKIVKTGELVEAMMTEVGNAQERPHFINPRTAKTDEENGEEGDSTSPKE